MGLFHQVLHNLHSSVWILQTFEEILHTFCEFITPTRTLALDVSMILGDLLSCDLCLRLQRDHFLCSACRFLIGPIWGISDTRQIECSQRCVIQEVLKRHLNRTILRIGVSRTQLQVSPQLKLRMYMRCQISRIRAAVRGFETVAS